MTAHTNGRSGDGKEGSGAVCALKGQSSGVLDRWNAGWEISRGVRDNSKALGLNT